MDRDAAGVKVTSVLSHAWGGMIRASTDLVSEQQKNAATAGAQDEAEAPQAQDLVEAEKMATLG